MRTLNRQLLRELREHRGQVVSIALVVAAGVLSVITMRAMYRSLDVARDSYYRDYRFGHVFARLERAPETLARRVAAIPGVATVDRRIVRQVVVDVPGLDQPATGQIVSVPADPETMLNRVHLRAGRWTRQGSDDEAIVSERFVTANGLGLGDSVGMVLNGRYRTIRIAGIGISPEFVYEVSPSGAFFTDERLFAVMWMDEEAVASAFDMTGAFNDLVLRLAPGASEEAVIARVDVVLEPWGGLGAYGRDDQLSARLLRDEIQQNRVTATVLPMVFLGVAAFLLHIVLLRMVATQRQQIALLKAFGYPNRDIAWHYLRFALAAVLVGAVLGILAGMWLGSAAITMYEQFFAFPSLDYVGSPLATFGALAVAAIAALVGAGTAVRDAIRLEPAVGMRAESPAVFRPLFLERSKLHRLFSASQRMILRNLERRPVRALLSSVGVGYAFATLLIGLLMLDSVSAMIDIQFRTVQREDADIAFNADRDIRALAEIARIPGVASAEPYRAVPVALTYGAARRRLGITGMEPGSELRPMVDEEGRSHALPVGGIVLSARLARSLGAAPGDTIGVEFLEQRSQRRQVVIAALVNELLGVNGYMAMADLERLTRDGPRISGAWVRIERGAQTRVFDALRDLPAVASTTSKHDMVRSFEAQISDSLGMMLVIVVLLAGILAVGVIYNGARIALSERGWELASLRVLGFRKREVAAMLLGEQAVITAVGIVLGGFLGVGLVSFIIRAYDTELYRMPLVLRIDTFLTAGLVVAAIAAGAGWLVRRKLDRADLIAVLKTRE
jgi:putative ABC transport system permease protein